MDLMTTEPVLELRHAARQSAWRGGRASEEECAMKLGAAACALAAACLFAAPASSGVAPPQSPAAPAALGRVPSGEIESGQMASAKTAGLLRIAPRRLTPLRQELPRVGRALDRMGRGDRGERRSAAGQREGARLLGQPERARLVSRRQLRPGRHAHRAWKCTVPRAPPFSVTGTSWHQQGWSGLRGAAVAVTSASTTASIPGRGRPCVRPWLGEEAS